MSIQTFRTSRPDSWVQPRPFSDPITRLNTYGRIQPMQQPGFFARLLGKS